MADFDNTNRGVLFRNDKASTDKHPTHTGSINIEGVDYWLSAWVKEGQKGKFFSLSVQPKEKQAPKQDKAGQWKAGAQKPQRQAEPEFEDDVPF